jgi:regulator of protease activity HflC (stomatin/prohibitin superfamily)
MKKIIFSIFIITISNSLNAQRDARQASIDEITQAIGDAQDKQNEFLGTAQEAEEQKVKDKYFKLLELGNGKDLPDMINTTTKQ